MYEVQRETRIGCSRFDESLGGECGDILALEQFAMFITSRSRCQKLFDEGKMKFWLIWNKRSVFTLKPKININSILGASQNEYARVRDASCSMPLWRSSSAKSNESLFKFFFNMLTARLVTNELTLGAVLKAASTLPESSLNLMFLPSCGRMPARSKK